MEIGGCFCLIPVFILGADKFDINEYFSFIVPYFQDNMNLQPVKIIVISPRYQHIEPQ